jgi:hypothetical protein
MLSLLVAREATWKNEQTFSFLPVLFYASRLIAIAKSKNLHLQKQTSLLMKP